MRLWTSKKTLLAVSAFALAGLALWLDTSDPKSLPETLSSQQTLEAGELPLTQTTSLDPELVFSKAFWRRIQEGDKVAHAERREWMDTGSRIAKWQWFIEFEPSADTLAWLATNPFTLAPQSALNANAKVEDWPRWFSHEFANHDLYQNANGRHLIAISLDGKSIYATDSGGGLDN